MQCYIINEPDGSESIFYYQDNFLSDDVVARQLRELDVQNDFIPNYNFNRTSIIRSQKWYHHRGTYFCPEWKSTFRRWSSFKYTPALSKFQEYVVAGLNELRLDVLGIHPPDINSCLIQKYASGDHSIRAHRDTDKAFGETPTIIGISIGAQRELHFKRVKYNGKNSLLSKKDKQHSNLNFKFTLKSGSVFIMSGQSQKYWTHEIPKSDSKGVRYSYTFREHLF